ncbi:hypothetical protein SAMN05892883_3802 [Jatrophihabitans sp. GAS493]|uniref:DUF6285 domain-containing protein n=1 Tax=Jatrophihabitans sp. GAS493 TaxID=1907575 RepID=UPI000BB79256|nr:DUF6285 domain-containing protein [Jatrophihabitans sp. GAS493]SOD74616.1 hypothetical protein SAMN05892883_3802 [Jatrophihabitans sp. GAS493]
MSQTPHDVPSAIDLLAAVEEFLTESMLPAADDDLRFYVRVSANVLAVVRRELTLGPELARHHDRDLELIGCADETELAQRLRSGSLDYRNPLVRDVITRTVRAKLAVARPSLLTDTP